MSHMLATPDEPIFVLKDHVAPEPVTLRANHHGKGGFTFSKTLEGAPADVMFTADSRTGGLAPRRLIKDATGNGILELWRNVVGDESYISHPSGTALPLATVAPRATRSKDKVDVYVKDAAGENEYRLEIRGQDIWKRNTLVYHGNDLVMQMRFVNYITSFVPFSGNQWDVAVAQGFDLSLACAIVVYLGTTVYDNTRFRSTYGIGATEDQDNERKSGKWQVGRVSLTTVAAAAGAGAGASC